MRGRKEVIEYIANREFDVCIIGGGTGCGCALDARLRGLDTLLLDAGDFASGSSTASTKMVHGGVRYLQEAVQELDVNQYELVKHALQERAVMLRNAPYLTRTVEFLVPCFSQFEKIHYGLGMKMYDWIAGKSGLLPSRLLTKEEALHRMPTLESANLVGAISYADGQFDDGRYAMALAETFVAEGGEALNYARAIGFGKNEAGKIISVTVSDQRSSAIFQVRARAFVNATGPFSDVVRQLATDQAAPRMHPSKGVHIMFPLDGFPEADALLVVVGAAIFSKKVAAGGPAAGLGPYLAGVSIWAIGLSLGGTTGYAINPARDLGPRIAHALLPVGKKLGSGWNYAAVPVVGPLVGAALAGILVRVVKF